MISASIFTLGQQKDNFVAFPIQYPVKTQPSFSATSVFRELANHVSTDYIILYTGTTAVKLNEYAIDRMLQLAQMTRSVFLYSDYYKINKGAAEPHPTIEYQIGSLRDDFDFGPLLVLETTAFREAVSQMEHDFHYAALYELRLIISRLGAVCRIPEYLYTVTETDFRGSGEKQFDYVDPKNKAVQQEMELACTSHLKAIGAWLPPIEQDADFSEKVFPVEASVIIPVKNRVSTIADAVRSALSQKTTFPYNIIVIDNHSTDGTTELLQQLSREEPRLVHHIPASGDLGIGGCWTEAVMLPACGKFSIQLDSDDLYINPQVLQKITETFYAQQCAMVIGSYRMVNFNLEEIPPGIIDHREWTPDNGHNNALRINGLGAPRAFLTAVIRKIKFPNVSYGEDYAVGLAISGEYRIGRIFEPLYLCRRWEGNSDSALDIQRLNTYNFYKDKIRTLEICKRISVHRNNKA